MGAARKTTHTHQINGGTVQLLAENTYDELGKLISKKVYARVMIGQTENG
mgnify:CR=1 FL=1